MSNEAKKPQGQSKPQKQGGADVVQIVAQCKFEGCKHKPTQFGFCKDHYDLYMAGVIRGDGRKPIDYEEKLALWTRKTNRKVA